MTASSDPQSLASATRIDALCDQFESAWRAGQPQRIEDLLVLLPEGERATALTALLRVELELRQRSGERPQASDYQSRFVRHTATVMAVFEESARRPTTDTSVDQAQTRTMSVGHDRTAATSEEPQPAEIGRFIVVNKVGEGAFGMVYRARDPQLDREVAIKVPRAGTLTSPTDVERFLREAKAAATMQHPNICPVYEVGTANGRPYIVMALVPGKSLAEHIKDRKEPFPARQAALIIRKLAQSLELAHQRGIIHRDLKPANILIDRDRKDVVVMDFGLARRDERDAAQLTQSGVLMGTPAYMSPEQARGDQAAIGPASDVYSLGVILYELLAGGRPYTGSMAEVLGKILHVDPPPPSAVRKDVDPRLETICMRAMARRPADRFTSMRALAEALGGWLKGSPHVLREESVSRSGIPSEESPQSQVDEMFTALSADLKAETADQQAKTEAAVEAAARRAQIPLWQLLTAAAIFAGLVAAGIIFFARTPTTTVVINIENIDLQDATLSFNLDGKEVTGAGLEKPIELKVGTHELIVFRETKQIRKYTFAVSMDAGPRIELQEELSTRLKDLTSPNDRAAAEWVLSVNGSVRVTVGDQLSDWIAPGGTLPQGPFQVNAVFTPDDGTIRDEAELRVLAGLPGLRHINFEQHVTYGNATMEVIETLTGLEKLRFEEPNAISDAGLARLAALKNLRELNLVSPLMSDASLAVIARLPELEVLDLAVTSFVSKPGGWMPNISEHGIAHLKGAAKLRRLNMFSVAVNDAGLRALGELRQIRALHVGGPEVTDAGLKGLAGMTELETLYLSQTAVTDAGLIHLSGLNNLAGLTLHHMAVTDDGLVHLQGLKNLAWLSLDGSPISGVGAEHLVGLEKLRQLNLWGSPVTDAGLEQIKLLKRVTLLDIRGSKVTDAGVPHLTAMAGHLKVLHLIDTKISDASVPHLVKLTELTGLTVEGSQITPAGLRELKRALPKCSLLPEPQDNDRDRAAAEWVLQIGGQVVIVVDENQKEVNNLAELPQAAFKLTTIAARGRPVNDSDLPSLNGLRDLKALNLERTNVTDAGLEHLRGLPKLLNLSLVGIPITDAGLAPLADLKLATLNLNGTQISDDGLPHLSAMTSLRHLWLGNTKTSDVGLKRLQPLSNLIELGLEKTKVTDEGLQHLEGMKDLSWLFLFGTQIGDAGLEHLSEKRLGLLDLRDTTVTDAGIERLHGMQTLGILWLSGTGITDRGLETVGQLKALGELHLDRTRITNYGLAHLKGLHRLHYLGLHGTPISDAGLVHLQGLKGLKNLGLSGTQVTDAGVAPLKAALPNCQIAK